MPAATLTTKGQVTIPKIVREALLLHTGSVVEFTLTGDGGAILRPRQRPLSSLFGILPSNGHRVTVEEMDPGEDYDG